MTHIIQKIGIVCFLSTTIACNFSGSNSAKQKSQMNDTLKFTGCQEQINLKSGVLVELKLEAIQGTGYQWLLKEPSPLLQQMESDVLEYSSPANKENMTGQAGFQILRFKALEKGKGVIQLEYKRTFEKEVGKSCVIAIEVE